MRIARHAAAVLLLSASPVWAQGAATGPEPAPAGTADGAKAVIDGLVPFLGRGAFDGGIVKVDPDPAGYRMSVDLQSLFDKVKSADAELRLSPYSFVVSRRDDGNWNVFSDAKLDVGLKNTLNGVEQTFAYEIGPQRFKGVYSPAIASFLSGSGGIDRLTMKATDAASDIAADFGKATFELTGSPAADGAANLSMRQTLSGFSETVKVKEGPDVPPGGVSLDFKAKAGDINFSLAAVRSRQLLDLYSFFVTHPEYAAPAPDKAKLAAGQDELKARIRAAFPLWNRLDGDYVLSGLEVGSQFGRFTADSFRFAFGTAGLSKAGSVTYAFGFRGLGVSSPAVPAWAATLLPKTLDLRLRLDNLDLQTPADIALADLDVARPEPIGEDARLRISETFTNNPPRFVMEPSSIEAEDLKLAMSGSFAVGDGKPAATMDITAAGLDKAIATLQGAAEKQPEINQVVGGLSIAKGFGKSLPDGRVQWVVDASSDGSVKVNGFQIKPPDPVALPNQDLDDGDDSDDDDVAPDETPPNQAPTDDNAVPNASPQP